MQTIENNAEQVHDQLQQAAAEQRFEEGYQVAQEILENFDLAGFQPLDVHELVRQIAADAYARGVVRASEDTESITSEAQPAARVAANPLFQESATDTIDNVCAALEVIDSAVLACAETGQTDDFSWGVTLLMRTIKEALHASSMPTGAVDKRTGAMLDENGHGPVQKSA